MEDLLANCWLETADLHQHYLAEDETEGEQRLKLYVSAAERGMQYLDPQTLPELEATVASTQIGVAARYAQWARQSGVLNRPDGTLVQINDRKHKNYAKLAIRMAQEGRARLEPHPTAEDYDDEMARANDVLADAYLNLYNLTWAHTKMSKAIKTLKQAVAVVPDDPDLWNALGRAYEKLAHEWVSETEKGMDRGAAISSAMGGWSGCAEILGRGLVALPLRIRVGRLQKKAAECYQRALYHQ